MKGFLTNHFDTVLTVGVTILGFVITYFMTKRNFKDEIKKEKIGLAVQEIHSLPYDICQLMDDTIHNKINQETLLKNYQSILSRVLAYGSKDAIKITIKMQQLSYQDPSTKGEQEKFLMLAAYSLLITQLKYDLTSEIISPESYFELRMNDYKTVRSNMKKHNNTIVDELHLNPAFRV